MNELLCLQCPLKDCNDRDPRCLIRLSPEDKRREARRAYHREYDAKRYERIKDEKKVTNAAYWKEYAKRTDRTEYYREYRRRKNAQAQRTEHQQTEHQTQSDAVPS